ncbi:MAG: DegT/DnrJ/EryC1/StrS family aminotransferase [Pararhodobacter sp.]|nr:DegT/DnrJ/EryC1/StrS family aminotransferase [Pararhodobacter sp.]
MTVNMIDLARQEAAMGDALRAAIAQVLDHKGFINGPEVRALEAALALRLGPGWQAIGCANGTDALHLMLRAAGIGPGDGVALPALTFVATAEAVRLTGAVPVFVDTDAASGTLCPDSLVQALEAAAGGALPRLRAVLPVDLFALPADHERIGVLAQDHGLVHLVDAAHSYGGMSADGPCGTQGLASATSFYPSKALGCYGDGGAVFTADTALATRIRGVANHGALPGEGEHSLIGTNSRLDTLQAAVLLTKLTHFDTEIAARRRIAARYLTELADCCALPPVAPGATPVWSYFTIRHERRDELAAHLAARDIRSVAYYRQPIHRQPAYSGDACVPGGLPGTESFARTLLCLPMHPYLHDHEVDAVIAAVRAFVC